MGCSTLVSTAPTTADLRLYVGDDAFIHVTVTDPDTQGPADLTGCVAQSQIRATADAVDIQAEFATEIVDNIIYLTLTSAETTGQAGRAVWDVQITDADGVVATLAGGKVTWVAEVTR